MKYQVLLTFSQKNNEKYSRLPAAAVVIGTCLLKGKRTLEIVYHQNFLNTVFMYILK